MPVSSGVTVLVHIVFSSAPFSPCLFKTSSSAKAIDIVGAGYSVGYDNSATEDWVVSDLGVSASPRVTYVYLSWDVVHDCTRYKLLDTVGREGGREGRWARGQCKSPKSHLAVERQQKVLGSKHEDLNISPKP